MDLRRLLEKMMDTGASDLHLKTGTRPILRVDGVLGPTDDPPLNSKDLDAICDQVLTPKQKEQYLREREIDFAFGVPGLARFRANFFYQRGTAAMAVRHVPLGVPAIEDLNLPPIVEQLSSRARGLILVTGTVGSGKSTTLASMIDCINRSEARNVITVEDPIEFLHRDEKSIINQREVGLDTGTYLSALKHILRQDPDVILLGEIRDQETMSIALMAADTGHLVLSTLHTIDAPQTVNRILSFYPPHQHAEIRFLLASTLQAVISQRLIQRAEGKGRVPAVEVMLNTAAIGDYLMSPEKTLMIKSAIQEGAQQYGMQTFDQSLMSLFTQGLITYDAAMQNASNPSELDLRMRGISSSSDTTWSAFEGQTKEEEEEEGAGKTLSQEPPDVPKGITKY
ncbi:MAG: type IV pilus twitching motility protein PilT [Candidatus Eisenbacteria bacterium]|uniref:Type IV pilus twitching motility protein PilT n=1 Tax=Eiseniibacteriota bacterium TaxID=2212470 RepID=A0A956NCM0_UNCEI|nr:type IV pilus twitching motility protein PilT [Candidatus Eisenbacteria bacterium]MCB9462344.1 type IV pilus twitching motility protein PilT [Candidatus Eisenbacteria bacterium]